MDDVVGHPTPEDLGPLRLRACPACDYALVALPPEGTCPECERDYDQRYIVLAASCRHFPA